MNKAQRASQVALIAVMKNVTPQACRLTFKRLVKEGFSQPISLEHEGGVFMRKLDNKRTRGRECLSACEGVCVFDRGREREGGAGRCIRHKQSTITLL